MLFLNVSGVLERNHALRTFSHDTRYMSNCIQNVEGVDRDFRWQKKSNTTNFETWDAQASLRVTFIGMFGNFEDKNQRMSERRREQTGDLDNSKKERMQMSSLLSSRQGLICTWNQLGVLKRRVVSLGFRRQYGRREGINEESAYWKADSAGKEHADSEEERMIPILMMWIECVRSSDNVRCVILLRFGSVWMRERMKGCMRARTCQLCDTHCLHVLILLHNLLWFVMLCSIYLTCWTCQHMCKVNLNAVVCCRYKHLVCVYFCVCLSFGYVVVSCLCEE